MKYHVVLLSKAESDLNAAADWIAKQSPSAADRWLDQFVEALLSLEIGPQRCGLAPENVAVPHEVRQLVFRPRRGRVFRALFTIVEDEVRVLRIRGAGQDLVQEGDWF
jgi:toxin ParE1/3/4